MLEEVWRIDDVWPRETEAHLIAELNRSVIFGNNRLR